MVIIEKLCCASQQVWTPEVRKRSEVDISLTPTNVRFTAESGHYATSVRCQTRFPKFDANQCGPRGCRVCFPISIIFREDAMSHRLVPSDRVEAAVVYGPDGQKIGTIERLMLEKLSGTVAYAVVKCGGVLKGHIHHYPLPCGSLKYNATREAYETDVSLEQLRSGPSELNGEAFDWGNRSWTYPQYWIL